MSVAAQDFPALLDLLDSVFCGSRTGESERKFPHILKRENLQNLCIIKEKGEVVSHIGLLYRRMRLGPEEIPLAIISLMATRPDFRRQGYATSLLKFAIEKMKQDKYQMAKTTFLDDVKNIFIEMKDQEETFEPDQEQAELYAKAQEIEKKSQQFYHEKARQADIDDQKKLFERLAKEEEKHYFLLENIIDFVSRPEQWLENAEWYHLEEY